MKIAWIAIGVVLAGVLVAMMPDLVRYIKLRSM